MFLNDLQNRLQPSAVPKKQNLQEGEVTPSDIISQSNCQKPLETESVIFALNHLQTNTSSYVPEKNSEMQRKRDECMENKEIQTVLSLSNNTPRKKLLKRKNSC